MGYTSIVWLDEDRPEMLRHPDSGRVVAFTDSGSAFRAAVALGLGGFASPGTVQAPLDEVVHLVPDDAAASDLMRTLGDDMDRRFASAKQQEEEAVLVVLEQAGPRGASHEQFVEAGLAPGYIAVLRRLVDDRGCEVKVDFTSGSARWALPTQLQHAA